jgi:hypothetical protein
MFHCHHLFFQSVAHGSPHSASPYGGSIHEAAEDSWTLHIPDPTS